MPAPAGFPVVMTHPQYKAAETWVSGAGDGNFNSSPARFPPVTVNDENQEAMYRARGYLRYGEAMPKVAEYSEYPLMMSHPDHADAVPVTMGARMENGQMIQFTIAGTAEKLAPVTVTNADQEEHWRVKGYARAGHTDEHAFEKATVSPGEPGDEWPQWVEQEDGTTILMQDPDSPVDDPDEYPKCLNFADGTYQIAKDRVDEANILKARGSSKSEPVKKAPEPATIAAPFSAVEWQEFKEFQAWKAAQAVGKSEMRADTSPLDVAHNEGGRYDAPVPAESIDALRVQAAELGINVDKRWGTGTLQREIDTALNA